MHIAELVHSQGHFSAYKIAFLIYILVLISYCKYSLQNVKLALCAIFIFLVVDTPVCSVGEFPSSPLHTHSANLTKTMDVHKNLLNVPFAY